MKGQPSLSKAFSASRLISNASDLFLFATSEVNNSPSVVHCLAEGNKSYLILVDQ